jgi:hypothetical protein
MVNAIDEMWDGDAVWKFQGKAVPTGSKKKRPVARQHWDKNSDFREREKRLGLLSVTEKEEKWRVSSHVHKLFVPPGSPRPRPHPSLGKARFEYTRRRLAATIQWGLLREN